LYSWKQWFATFSLSGAKFRPTILLESRTKKILTEKLTNLMRTVRWLDGMWNDEAYLFLKNVVGVDTVQCSAR